MSQAKREPVPAPRAKGGTGRARGKSAVRLPLEVGELRRRTLIERLKDDTRTGIPGLLVSLGLHAVLLIALAVLVVSQREVFEEPGLDATWIAPAAERTTAAAATAPVRIESVKLTPAAERTEPVKPAAEASPQETRSNVPVKPAPVQQMLNGRDPAQRERMLAKAGANDKVERAISQGLMWLARQQQSAGNWRLHDGYPDASYANLRTDTGATALALLAFLGNGQTHLRTGGEHQEVIRKGLLWLKSVQKENGDFHDHVELGRQTAFYAHSQATIVMCEAFALTQDAELREPAERGVAFLVESQRNSVGGGWKYQPIHEKGDLSVTGWALMALHTARAAGIEVPEEAFASASVFLDSVQVDGGAKYKYEPDYPSTKATAAMTAEGLLCRQFLGWPKDHPALLEGIEFLRQPEFTPEWSAGRRNVYAWYYTGHVLHNVGGAAWKEWYQQAATAIADNQVKTGSGKAPKDIRGSWHPTNPPGDSSEHADKAGRLYLTVMSILVLEMPYRHLPVYGEADIE